MGDSKKWQLIRGISIFCVIQIHCLAGIGDRFSTFDQVYYLIVRNIINFPVPLFFFISGYFAVNTVKRYVAQKSWGGYFKNRIIRLLLPYFTWSIIYLLPSVIRNFDLKTVIICLITGKAAAPFYYIVVLGIFTAITPLLNHILHTRYKMIPLVLAVALFLQLYIWQLKYNDIWKYVHFTPVWLPFYYAGMYYKTYIPKHDIVGKKNSIGIFVAIFILQVIENIWIQGKFGYSTMAYGMIRIGGFLYSGILSVVVYKFCTDTSSFYEEGNSKLLQSLVFIGDNSYGIFYIHYIGIILFQKLIKFEAIGSLPIYRGLELFFSLFLSIVTIFIVKKVIGNKCSSLLLGF